jgi:hypothetical protein
MLRDESSWVSEFGRWRDAILPFTATSLPAPRQKCSR